MDRIRKPITITFEGGPIHGIKGETLWLPEANMIVDEKERIIYAYIRDELTYHYDHGMSVGLTANFNNAAAAFKRNEIEIVEDENNALDLDD